MKDFKDIQIAVAGTGYVGFSIATLLSLHHEVTAVDVIPERWRNSIRRFLRFKMSTSKNIWQRSLCA